MRESKIGLVLRTIRRFLWPNEKRPRTSDVWGSERGDLTALVHPLVVTRRTRRWREQAPSITARSQERG